MRAIETAATGTSAASGSGATGGASGSSSPDNDPVLKQLNDRLTVVENHKGDRFNSPKGSLGGPHEVEQHTLNKNVASSGAFWDPFSVMVVVGKGAQSGKDLSDEKFSASRVQLTVNETDLKGAMTHCLPACLFAKRGGTVSVLEAQKISMQGCPSYSDWIGDGRESYGDHLTDLLHDQVESVCETIDDADGGSSLSTWCLDWVLLQWAGHVTFVEKFHTKLVNVAKFPSARAWRLVGCCSSAVFGAMRHHLSKVIRLGDLGVSSQKAAMIWAVLQCHRIMEEFAVLKFESHSFIIREISVFILTERVHPEELDQVKADVWRLKEERAVTPVAPDTTVPLAEFNALKRKVNNPRNEINQLKDKKPKKPNKNNSGGEST